MTSVSNNSSAFKHHRNVSPSPFHSASMPNISVYYDRSIIVPLKLKTRKVNSTKFHSILTRSPTIREEREIRKPLILIEEEDLIIRQKLDRIRINLAQTLENHRHTAEKIQHKKHHIHQLIDERNSIIEQLFNTEAELNAKIDRLRDETIRERRHRDTNEMHQMRLRRTLKQLQKVSARPDVDALREAREKLIEECESRIGKLRKEYQKEIAATDEQIEELKEKLMDRFSSEADEYKKLLRATERAHDIESEKRNLLQEFVDDYERNIYRAIKPCCLSTSMRLNHQSTRYRLYCAIELALHELLRSSYACGQFGRSYETFLRLHEK